MTTTCALFCPAYAHLSAEERARAQRFSAQVSERLNWQLQSLPSCQAQLTSGCWLPAADRLSELQAAWSAQVLWAMRGGYGCVQLVEALAQWSPKRAPLLIGYSDLTTLHGLWQRQGWGPSLYAAMPALPAGPRASDSLCHLLHHQALTVNAADYPSVQVLRTGHASGPSFAGCLSVLAAAVGSPLHMPDLRGRILFIEDIDERPYAIDRYLWQLWLGGHLQDVAALVGGRFPVNDAPPNPATTSRGPSLHSIFSEWATRLPCPVLYGLPFGHDEDPLTIPCGGQAQLSSANEGRWQLVLHLS